MRVLHLVDRCDLADGAAKHVLLLAREQQRRGDVVLVTTSGGDAFAVFESSGVPYQVIADTGHANRSVGGFVRGLRALRTLVAEWKPDIVHTHHFYSGNQMWFASPRMRGCLVQTIHAVIPPEGLLPHCPGRRIIAVSEAVRQGLIRRDPGLATRVTVVRNGSDFVGDDTTLRASAEYRTIASEKQNRFVLAFLGRLTEVKGTRVLAAALDLLAQRHADALPPTDGRRHGIMMLFAGTGSDQHLLRDACERCGVPAVFLSPQPNVLPLLEAADALLLPSLRMEGLPMLLVEAGLAGTPVIASCTDGIPELVVHEEHGLLVEPGNAPALADAIGRILADNALRERLSQALRQRVHDSFSVTGMVDGVLRVYAQLAPSTTAR